MSKLVCGIGFNDRKYLSVVNKSNTIEYEAWRGMLRRCMPEYQNKNQTYIGVTCSENFKSYSFFYEWCQTQIGFGNTDENGSSWQLDKDLLVRGNKVYSEYFCVFVPQRVNSLLTKNDATRGEFPVGVWWHKSDKKFRAQCRDGKGKSKHIVGQFSTPQEAFQAYKKVKESYIKQVANEYRTQLDHRAYEALINYQVNIND